MSNPSKQKGTAWESALVAWLREHGYPRAERRALAGVNDCGDVSGVPGIVIEAKNVRTIRLHEWVDEARREAANAGVDLYCVALKRTGTTDPAQGYGIVKLDDLLGWLTELHGLRAVFDRESFT